MDKKQIDSKTFYMLDNSNKMSYILYRLQDAKFMFKIINDSFIALNSDEIAELVKIGDSLVSIGVLAEDMEFSGLYELLEKPLSRLEELSSKVYFSSFS